MKTNILELKIKTPMKRKTTMVTNHRKYIVKPDVQMGLL